MGTSCHCPQSRAVTSSIPPADRGIPLSAIGKMGERGPGEVALSYLTRSSVKLRPISFSLSHYFAFFAVNRM